MKNEYKAKICQLLAEKGMYSTMNSSKWRELKNGIAELPFQPPFEIKCVDEEELPRHKFDKDVYYTCDWGLYLENYLGGDMHAVPYYAVEWIKVRPRYLKRWPHRLLPDPGNIAEDVTEQFVEILRKYNIPYKEDNGAFIIYGYILF